MNKILVIATHPDDETLGCGGTLLKHKNFGDEIHWLIATDIKESEGFDKTLVEKRNIEINIVEEHYNFNSVSKLGISTTRTLSSYFSPKRATAPFFLASSKSCIVVDSS